MNNETTVLFTRTHCPICKMAEKTMENKGIEFVCKNIDEDEEALSFLQDRSIKTVPVLVLKDGEETKILKAQEIIKWAREV